MLFATPIQPATLVFTPGEQMLVAVPKQTAVASMAASGMAAQATERGPRRTAIGGAQRSKQTADGMSWRIRNSARLGGTSFASGSMKIPARQQIESPPRSHFDASHAVPSSRLDRTDVKSNRFLNGCVRSFQRIFGRKWLGSAGHIEEVLGSVPLVTHQMPRQAKRLGRFGCVFVVQGRRSLWRAPSRSNSRQFLCNRLVVAS